VGLVAEGVRIGSGTKHKPHLHTSYVESNLTPGWRGEGSDPFSMPFLRLQRSSASLSPSPLPPTPSRGRIEREVGGGGRGHDTSLSFTLTPWKQQRGLFGSLFSVLLLYLRNAFQRSSVTHTRKKSE
jgi:hypothetical protein